MILTKYKSFIIFVLVIGIVMSAIILKEKDESANSIQVDNVQVDGASGMFGNEKIQSEINELLARHLQIERSDLPPIVYSMHYLGDSENMKIIALMQETPSDARLWIIDDIEGEYSIVFEKKYIEYFHVLNDSLISFTTYNKSPGTGIVHTVEMIYAYKDDKFFEVFSKEIDTLHADMNGEILGQGCGKITFLDDRLIYEASWFNKEGDDYVLQEASEVYKLDQETLQFVKIEE